MELRNKNKKRLHSLHSNIVESAKIMIIGETESKTTSKLGQNTKKIVYPMPSIKRNGLRKITIMGKTKKIIEACVARTFKESVVSLSYIGTSTMELIC